MKRFWDWYQRHYLLNVGISAGLFSLQVVHLFWLLTHVIWLRLFGSSLFTPTGVFEWLIIVVDYTEIPALFSTGLLYVYQLRKQFSFKTSWFLFSLVVQLVHIFWITDEFVLGQFAGQGSNLPGWVAWVAILIDYLEVPVIIETIKLFFSALKHGNTKDALEAIRSRD